MNLSSRESLGVGARTQKRILIAWEIGSGMGHVRLLQTLSRALETDGHEVTLAVKDLSQFEEGVLTVQAPELRAPERVFPYSLNYADNLYRNGFWHTSSLIQAIGEWLELFERHQPDLLLCEFAPVAMLAAQLVGLKRAAIGGSFWLPPSIVPMPTFQPWFDIPQSLLQAREERLLASINEARRPWTSKRMGSVAELFDGCPKWVCTPPELDHFGERDDDTMFLGPMAPRFESPSRPDTRQAFIYLRSGHTMGLAVLEALQKLSWSSVAFIPEASDELVKKAPTLGCTVISNPIDLSWVKQNCSLTITQGGAYSASEFLTSGLKLLICPVQLEQALLGWRLSQRGIAASLPFLSRHSNVLEKLEALTNQAQSMQIKSDGLGLSRMVKYCRELLALSGTWIAKPVGAEQF
jgi:UDP:flavonoid glycosyltransferase YjiC (YdhE family)